MRKVIYEMNGTTYYVDPLDAPGVFWENIIERTNRGPFTNLTAALKDRTAFLTSVAKAHVPEEIINNVISVDFRTRQRV